MMTNTKDLTPDHIKSHLQKYRLHRERAREEFLANYIKSPAVYGRDSTETDTDMDGASALRSLSAAGGGPPSAAAVVAPSQTPTPAVDDPFRSQMSLIRDCIQMQSGFQSVLRQALVTQTQLQQQLQAHLQALGLDGPISEAAIAATIGGAGTGAVSSSSVTSRAASIPGGGSPSRGSRSVAEEAEASHPSRHPHHHHAQSGGGHQQQHQSHAARRPATAPVGVKRSAEELMQEEMKEHMDMHRQLVLRKNAQVRKEATKHQTCSFSPMI